MNVPVEFRDWGWNATTFWFLGTLVFSGLQAWGLNRQRKRMGRMQSGKSIPMLSIAYTTASCAAFVVYGYRTDSVAKVVNGLLCILHLANYLTAARYADCTGKKRSHAVLVTLPLLMIVLQNAPATMFAFNIVNCFVLTQAPLTILRNRSAGAVEPRFTVAITVSSLFWVAFSRSIGDPLLSYVCAYNVCVGVATLLLWRKYSPPSVHQDFTVLAGPTEDQSQ